jgi:hypothetical protein
MTYHLNNGEKKLFLFFLFNNDRPVRKQRGDGANSRQLRGNDGADHSNGERYIDQRFPVIILNNDAPDIALPDQFLDLRKDLFTIHSKFFSHFLSHIFINHYIRTETIFRCML